MYISVYQEAALLEEKCENYDRSIEISELGLQVNPRYGPLWFTLLRLHEKIAQITNQDLTEARALIERSVNIVPKELKWKLYFECAQMEERFGNLEATREAYVKSVTHCPKHLLWKVWLAGARTELRLADNGIVAARKLIQRSISEVPEKKRAQVFLGKILFVEVNLLFSIEWSRIEEFHGNVDDARSVLSRARKEAKHEWKIFLESVLLELRSNNLSNAMKQAEDALKIHAGTGRLWSLLIQMNQQDESEQMRLFKLALQEVPKSGEVWCEGARIFLINRDYVKAEKFLEFAIHFTPQYGDSFVEYLRLKMIQHKRVPNMSKLELVLDILCILILISL